MVILPAPRRCSTTSANTTPAQQSMNVGLGMGEAMVGLIKQGM
jgi:hypothetical protein